MNRGNTYTVKQVLHELQTDQLHDSCDENEEAESFDSDTDSGEDEQVLQVFL